MSGTHEDTIVISDSDDEEEEDYCSFTEAVRQTSLLMKVKDVI